MNIIPDLNKKTSTPVSKRNDRRGIKPCLAAKTHKQQCHHELLNSINKDRPPFIDGPKNCKDCIKVLETEYSECLNEGQLSISFTHYIDIIDGVAIFNLANSAYCQHEEPRKLRQGFKEISGDFEASVKDRRYVLNFKNAYTALEYLSDQQFVINDGDYDSDVKYIIGLPKGRVSTTEDEARALSLQSNRHIITNFEDRCFWVLNDNKSEASNNNEVGK